MVRYLLIEAKLPKYLSAYVLKTAAYIRNRCFNNRTNCTPYETFTSKKPDASHMQIFGSNCFAYVQDKKLDARSKQGVFLGYDTCSPAYLVYFPKENSIKRIRCVKFSSDLNSSPTMDNTTENNEPINKNYLEIPNSNTGMPDLTTETDNNVEHQVETKQSRKYPKRNRNKPQHFSDYITDDDPEMFKIVKCSVDYCYRMIDIPSTYQEALSSDEATKWKCAMDEEISAIQENKIYDIVELPEGKSLVGSKWIYSVKLGAKDEETFKARLVAKGYSQKEHIDFTETPTVKMPTIKVLLQLAVENDYKLEKLDFKSDFLNAYLDKEIYLQLPEGFLNSAN